MLNKTKRTMLKAKQKAHYKALGSGNCLWMGLPTYSTFSQKSCLRSLNLEKLEQTLKVNELDQHLSFLENKHICLCLWGNRKGKKRILEKYSIFPLKFSGK